MPRLRTFLVSIYFLMANFCFGQLNYQWAFNLGTNQGIAVGEAITSDNSDNIILVGFISQTVDMDPGSGVSNLIATGSFDNIFIAKYDHQKNLLWAFSIGSSGQIRAENITIDHNDNIYVSGGFTSSFDFDPGIGVFALPGTNHFQGFLAKYDSAGNFIWAIPFYDGSTNYTTAGSIECDLQGNIFVVGNFDLPMDADPSPGISMLNANGTGSVFICKYDSSGNLLFAKMIEGSNSNSARNGDIEISSTGNLFITGRSEGTVDLDPGSSALLTMNVPSIFIVSLDSSGNFLWGQNIGPDVSTFPFKVPVSIDAMDNIYITGNLAGVIDFDSGPANTNDSALQGSGDLFIAKYNSSGAFIWAETFGSPISDFSRSIDIDVQGNIFITGEIWGAADFDPGIGTAIMGTTSIDAFFAAYDQNGTYLSSYCISGSNNADSGNDVVCNTYGSFFCGRLFGIHDFDPGPSNSNYGSSNNANGYLVNYSSVTGVNQLYAENSISVYPNPSSDFISLHLSTPINGTGIIYNSMGQEVSTFFFDTEEGKIPVGHLSDGFYFIVLYFLDGSISTQKFEIFH